MKNKILINLPDLNNKGGVVQYYKNLHLDQESNISYFKISNPTQNVFYRLISTYINYIKVIRDYDIIILNPSLNAKSFFRDGIFAFFAKRKRKKIVIFWHGWLEHFEKKIRESLFLKKFFDNTYLKADGYIVLGEVFYKKLVKLGIRESLPFFKASMLLPREYDNLSLNDKILDTKKFNILFLSRIVKGKGVNVCIDLAQLLIDKYPDQDILMHIAGDGDELTSMKTYAKSLGLNNVVFHGYITGQDKIDLFKKSDVFFFPSETEGFPNVIIEALFFGLPVVTRPVGAIPEIIIHEKNGYLNDSKKATDYVKYFDQFITNRNKLKQIAKLCHEEAVNKYNYFHVRKRVLEFYNSL